MFDELYIEVETHAGFPVLDTISKTIRYGENILKKCVEIKGLKQSDSIILAMYRKILEQTDGIYILVDHGSNSALITTIRSQYETTIGFQHIFEKPQLIEKRALAYQVSYSNEHLHWFKKEINKGDILKRFKIEDLRRRIEFMETFLNSNKTISSVNERWHRKYKSTGSKRYPKWYSLYDDKANSFSALARSIRGTSPLIYSSYSMEAHGYNALDGVYSDEINKKQYLFPLRGIPKELDNILLACQLTNICTMLLVKKYKPELLDNYLDFYEWLNMRNENENSLYK
ncbi:DUF5677 domain-containing protein [Metabacillus sp. 113a]|uniref:DUF5677 domain-containing protein n=1 Tax=Metabacillus sp. 113a TaxID=3404706 RepID=UPI003CE7A6C4